ncbi:MAG: nucleotidyltransferase family protein [Actinomycetota bacterium]
MGRPHPALIPLAGGRGLGEFDDPGALVDSAFEHKMGGLLWTAERDGSLLPHDQRMRLAVADGACRYRHGEIWRCLELVEGKLQVLGAETAVLKGIAAEARWYRRMGERPCSDLDLWLAPHCVTAIEDVVAALDPHHPLLGDLGPLVAKGILQSVDVRSPVPGIGIDMHIDPFKLGVRTRGMESMWARTEVVACAEGRRARILDAESSLILFLLHLNKDRFRYLLGFVDVVRTIEGSPIDRDKLSEIADENGLSVPVFRSLEVVSSTLMFGSLGPGTKRGWRRLVWDRAWRPGVRLQGHDGRTRFRYRQQLVGITARGRAFEAVRDTARKMIPSKPLFAYYQPGPPASYATLLRRRVRGWWLRRRERARKTPVSAPDRRSAAASIPGDG